MKRRRRTQQGRATGQGGAAAHGQETKRAKTGGGSGINLHQPIIQAVLVGCRVRKAVSDEGDDPATASFCFTVEVYGRDQDIGK